MKATCAECRTRIASDLAGENWHHIVHISWDAHTAIPEPGSIHHDCTIPKTVEQWRKERSPA